MNPRFSTAAAAALSLAATFAAATPPLQRKAKELGFPATSCAYCHSFDTNHMVEKAQKLRINPMDCRACHGTRLPKTGQALFNDRGKWLVSEKDKRKAEAVNPRWLKDYEDKATRDEPK